MRRLRVMIHGREAGVLGETAGGGYVFAYDDGYDGPPVSLAMPVRADAYQFDRFPPFFEGLLPEGYLLEQLLRRVKLDRDDLTGQLAAVGGDVVGAVTVEAIDEAPEAPGAAGEPGGAS